MAKKIVINVPYFQVSNQIFEVGLGKYDLLVYFYLARCGNNGGKAFPSYQTIADKCGISRRMAIDTVKELEEKKLIQKKVRKGLKSVKNQSNIYVVEHDIEAVLKKDESEKKADILMGAFRKAGANKKVTPEMEKEFRAAIEQDEQRAKEKRKWKQA